MAFRNRQRVLIALPAIAFIALALWFLQNGRNSRRELEFSSRAQAILHGLVVYAQNNGDQFPPPDHAASILVNAGLIDAQTLEFPGTPAGEPSFFLVSPQHVEQRWGNSFVALEPILYTNPASMRGGIHVAFNDNHVEYLGGEEASRFIAEVAARSVPLR